MQPAATPFRITGSLPLASREADAQEFITQLLAVEGLRTALDNPDARALVHSAVGNAPYLAQLMSKYPDQLRDVLALGFDGAWQQIATALHEIDLSPMDPKYLMRSLRELKARAALTIALADISGQWQLGDVTRALSHFAGDAVMIALRFLLFIAEKRGEFSPMDAQRPEYKSGIIILGMGKLGAFELNYSSDIDLIILFDKEILPYSGARNAQTFMNKLAADLMGLLQERTADGYVFRTDLRLRPDPMSTPLAVSTAAALGYYETVGQNWERAAMIKARPLAGDAEAATAYMQELVPFIWRKTLDFATVTDIHSIKRQMNVKSGKQIELYGHNIKIGRGGIREIEFFVQTQQLVWGGRIPELRLHDTLGGLVALCTHGLIGVETRDTLMQAYRWLRMVEHRLQMRNDEQTHTLPEDSAAMQEVALFMGYQTRDAFERQCLETLQTVQEIYTQSMVGSAPLAVDGNLVFTGVEADPETLATLARMGYQQAQRVSDIIQGWHRGHRRSTRSERARQLLTELIPELLTALAKTADPDTAFFYFDDFIDRMPSGVQIFSLLLSRPEILVLLADILGSAPALGDTLSNNPSLLDSVLEADFFLNLPTKQAMEDLVVERLRYAYSFEQKMLYLRSFNNEKRFQAGVHLLKRLATPDSIGGFLSDIAEIILQSTMVELWNEYRLNSSALLAHIPFAVLAFGKLGGREMTFGSDLDVVLVYDDSADAASEARSHLTRVAQRFLSALTLLTREGRLYEVDTRLRPGGANGPLVVGLGAFDLYFQQSAWTYEHMALTRARVVASTQSLFGERIAQVVARHVLKARDSEALLRDMSDMRARIARQFPTTNPWALKHVRGGMVDLDFIAQYLVLLHGNRAPSLWHRSAQDVFESAKKSSLLDAPLADSLIAAKKFMSDLMSLLRLCAPGGIIADDAPQGLKTLLVRAMRASDFTALEEQLRAIEAATYQTFLRIQNQEI